MNFDATPQGTQGGWESASAMVSRGAGSGSYGYTAEERSAGTRKGPQGG